MRQTQNGDLFKYGTDSLVDFGQCFRDGSSVCDYTPVHEAIADFLPTVVRSIGRKVTDSEMRSFEHLLRQQYFDNKKDLLMNGDAMSHVYVTPWQMQNGVPICVRITLAKRCSIVVDGATKKMTGFEVCTPDGRPIETLRSLPWFIDNLLEVNYALRFIWERRFPSELLSGRLMAQWRAVGCPVELPCTLWLCTTPDGRKIAIRFVQSEGLSADDGDVHVLAELLVDGAECDMKTVQPALYKIVDADALDSAMEDWAEMQGVSDADTSWLRRVLVQRFDYLKRQERHLGVKCCLTVRVPTGNGVESVAVFHTGARTKNGDALYALCREKNSSGRWTALNFVTADGLYNIGIDNLPASPDWRLEYRPLAAVSSWSPLSRHVLEHASRWTARGVVKGVHDECGRDVFTDSVVCEDAYRMACEQLEASLEYATLHPEAVAVGYYNPDVDHADSRTSPISFYVPGWFSDEARRSGMPDAAFVVRLVETEYGVRADCPTILPIDFVRFSASIVGDEFPIPDWLIDGCGSETGYAACAS